MPKNKYDTTRQIRIEPSLLRIIRNLQEKTEYSTSSFTTQAIKEYMKNDPKEIIDPRLELGVKFYEKKEKIFSFRLPQEIFTELLRFAEEREKKYTMIIYQAILYFIIRLRNEGY